MNGTLDISTTDTSARFSWHVAGFPEPYVMTVEHDGGDAWVINDSSDADPIYYRSFSQALNEAYQLMSDEVGESINR